MEGDVDDDHNVFKDGEDAVDSRFTIVNMSPVAEHTNQRKGELLILKQYRDTTNIVIIK